MIPFCHIAELPRVRFEVYIMKHYRKVPDKEVERLVNKFIVIEHNMQRNKQMNKQELLAEIEKLKRTMKLHAGDCCSLNNEVELFRGHWGDAEERCRELDKIIKGIEDWATIDFNESLLCFIRKLKGKD